MAAQGGSVTIGNTTVPAQYSVDVTNAAAQLGIPASVVAAQINLESGFDPTALSRTGAQGIAQFEPGTWASYGTGSPDNPTNAFAAYVKYMSVLLKQEGGSIYDALEAYNAGPGNLSAGSGYASTILSNAGEFDSIKQNGNGQIPSAGNGATEGGSGAAGTVSSEGAWTSWLGNAYNDTTGGLLTIPGTIIGTFGDVDEVVSKAYQHAQLFFRPSTYVRIGAGVAGAACMVTALVLLVKEAKQ